MPDQGGSVRFSSSQDASLCLRHTARELAASPLHFGAALLSPTVAEADWAADDEGEVHRTGLRDYTHCVHESLRW